MNDLINLKKKKMKNNGNCFGIIQTIQKKHNSPFGTPFFVTKFIVALFCRA